MELLLCVSQDQNETPYRFEATGIQVYSFEEALYHVYHYWKQSVDDIIDTGFTSWLNDSLGLSSIATKISEIAEIQSFSERMLAFLSLTEYFSSQELMVIKADLEHWEKRLEWETYKERADLLVKRGQPDKAISLYRRALQYGENIVVLNNISVAFMQIGAYSEASRHLEWARRLEPNNWELVLNHAEALILAKDFNAAASAIKYASSLTSSAEAIILYLLGELSFRMGQYDEAIPFFKQAIEISPEEQYIFRLADTYARKRQFDKALEILSNDGHNIQYLVKEAEVHEQSDNIKRAITAIERAIEIRSGLPDLWVLLAKYYRLSSDLQKAEEAINKAISLDFRSERAKLENARIMKRLGNTKAYQLLLKDILTELKKQHRDSFHEGVL